MEPILAEKMLDHIGRMVRRHTQSKNLEYVTGMTCEENFRC